MYKKNVVLKTVRRIIYFRDHRAMIDECVTLWLNESALQCHLLLTQTVFFSFAFFWSSSIKTTPRRIFMSVCSLPSPPPPPPIVPPSLQHLGRFWSGCAPHNDRAHARTHSHGIISKREIRDAYRKVYFRSNSQPFYNRSCTFLQSDVGETPSHWSKKRLYQKKAAQKLRLCHTLNEAQHAPFGFIGRKQSL